jgi:hypothetical protein
LLKFFDHPQIDALLGNRVSGASERLGSCARFPFCSRGRSVSGCRPVANRRPTGPHGVYSVEVPGYDPDREMLLGIPTACAARLA